MGAGDVTRRLGQRMNFAAMDRARLVALLIEEGNALIDCGDAEDTVMDLARLLNVDMRTTGGNEREREQET